MRIIPKSQRILAGTACVLLAGVASAPAMASPRSGQAGRPGEPTEVMYRCRDAKGASFVGQSIPPECGDGDIEVLDQSGRVVRVIPGRLSLQNVAAQQAAEDAKKAAAQRDRTLLATYLTVADIERLRDQRLEQLEQQARVTQQYIVNLKEREARLAEDVQRYKPYSSSPRAPALPDHVAEDIVNTVNGLQVYQQELIKNTTEQEKMRSEFAADIARFKELKGVN
jgi:hypothetical protein